MRLSGVDTSPGFSGRCVIKFRDSIPYIRGGCLLDLLCMRLVALWLTLELELPAQPIGLNTSQEPAY